MSNCFWCNEERVSSRRLEPGQPRECPSCGQVFKGNGWDGVDAHWKARHESSLLPYDEFWAGIPGVNDIASEDVKLKKCRDRRLTMKDYVVYHNPGVMGHPVTSVDPCRIVTNKTVTEEIIGSRVWLITGEGKPRAFFLRSCFFVDKVVSGTEHGFKTKLLGKHCRTFDPMVSLSDQDWFENFKRTQSNFNFGLQAITDHNFILQFEKLADKGKT